MIGDTRKNRAKFQTRKWVIINDESPKKYNSNNQIKFNTSFLKSDTCEFSETFIFFKETIGFQGPDERNASRQLSFKNCPPFTSCISEINNTQIDSAKYLDNMMPMCNLLEYNINSLKHQFVFEYFKVK